MLEAASRPGLDIARRVELDPDRHAAWRHGEIHRVAQHAGERAGERVAAACVVSPDARDVPLELAVFDQLRNRCLRGEIALNVQERPDRRDPADQLGRGDYVADPDSRCQNLRQRADIHHDAGAIGTGQRKDGTAIVVKLVIVVVLDDRHLPLLRQGQDLDAPGGFERHRGRILMVWREVDGAHRAALVQMTQRVDIDAVAVDRHRHHDGARRAECLPRRTVTPVFDGDDIPWPKQGAGHQRERHLAAPGDEHIALRNGESSVDGEHGREC